MPGSVTLRKLYREITEMDNLVDGVECLGGLQFLVY